MAEFVNLIDDISLTVKLGWLGVLLWGALQFVWYQRARVLPGEIDTLKPSPDDRPLEKLLTWFRRSADEDDAAMTRRGPLSIAPANDASVRVSVPATMQSESVLGEAAGSALENLLDDGAAENRDEADEEAHPTQEVRW
jgi:hypothetical protein